LVSGESFALGPDARATLTILATQAAIALQNAQMHERALAQASEDGLTTLLNHRAFQTRLEEEVARAHRGAHPLALLMIDMDDFGTINNSYGHQVGDAALAAIARAIRRIVRTQDVAARYGGDEFVVILPETAMPDALALADRMCEAIDALLVVDGGITIAVHASIGAAALPLHAMTREELLRAADQAAYAAKHMGKGRVGRPEDAAFALDRDPATLAARLEHANLATVAALAAAVDAKDPYTRGHSQRVSAYAGVLATFLQRTTDEVARVELAGLLHDVGKIGVPDAILAKPAKLDMQEYEIIRQHSATGEHMLSSVPFLHDVLPAVRHHHERWDGSGYPDALRGDEIPLDAAILMVADSLDAMTSSRTYRPALPLEEARRRILEGNGTQFHPDVVVALELALKAGKLMLLSSQVLAPPATYPLVWRNGSAMAGNDQPGKDAQLSA
jgi:diguanylate cyclase (GGDEF)-like protein